MNYTQWSHSAEKRATRRKCLRDLGAHARRHLKSRRAFRDQLCSESNHSRRILRINGEVQKVLQGKKYRAIKTKVKIRFQEMTRRAASGNAKSDEKYVGFNNFWRRGSQKGLYSSWKDLNTIRRLGGIADFGLWPPWHLLTQPFVII
jgi:hypothetical protein